METFSLKGKTLFITGASRGIGLAIALRAAREGANVAIAAKTVEPNPKLPGTIYTAAQEIEAAGGSALPLQCDIRFEEQVQEAVAKTVAQFGGIDVCINNASAISITLTTQTDMKRYDLMNQINARGTFVCSKATIPHLAKAENPHILNLAPPLDMQARWFIDEEVLVAQGVTDLSAYAYDPKSPLMPDFFVPDAVIARSRTKLLPLPV